MLPEDEQKIRDLLSTAQQRTMDLIQEHMVVILDVARTLISTSSLTGEQVLEICRRHGLEKAKHTTRREIFLDLLKQHGMEMFEL